MFFRRTETVTGRIIRCAWTDVFHCGIDFIQAIVYSISRNESDIDKMSDDSSDLMQLSGETRITVNVQQISSRFQSTQVAAKEILKKCEQAVADHRLYIDKYTQCASWLAAVQDKFATCSGSGDDDLGAIERKLKIQEEILAEQQNGTSLYNRVIEMAEKMYATTAVEGREAVRVQIQELQTAMESFYDNVASSERELQAKRSR